MMMDDVNDVVWAHIESPYPCGAAAGIPRTPGHDIQSLEENDLSRI